MLAVSQMRWWLVALVAIAAIVVISSLQAAISLADSVIHPASIALRAVREEQQLIPRASFEERWQLVYNSETPRDGSSHSGQQSSHPHDSRFSMHGAGQQNHHT
jgi:hypothetical protein